MMIRTCLVRGSAAKRRGELQQEWEMGEGSRGLHCNPMRAEKLKNVTITDMKKDRHVTLCTVGSQRGPLSRRQNSKFWAGSRPCCASHRGTYSPKYHFNITAASDPCQGLGEHVLEG